LNLLVRINLALIVVFAIAALAAAWTSAALLQAHAKREALNVAGLMIDSALAMRAYTAEEIEPLLRQQMDKEFLPQSIPFYAATQNFLRLQQHHPEYTYKEAALNPTNLRDRATDWEADLIEQFRREAVTRELVGERDTPGGRSLYVSRPIRAEKECLVCHSVPSAAPATLLAHYGSTNGFGWQQDEVIGAQVVSVPLAAALASADRVFRGVMTWIVVILALALLLVNAILYLLIVRPVRRIAAIADELSLGNLGADEFPAGGSPELQGLSDSFNRMRTSLSKAMRLLGG
jgi:protein-histidine pros-kinase